MSYWEPDDDDLGERAGEAGYLDPDDADQLRKLVKHWEFTDPFPRPGNRNDAIYIMLDHILNPPAPTQHEDPNITWAKNLLKDVI